MFHRTGCAGAHTSQLETTPVLPTRLLGEDLVLWRVGEQILAWRDPCVHRGTRLSPGRVANDTFVTPHDYGQSSAWMWMAMCYGHELVARG